MEKNETEVVDVIDDVVETLDDDGKDTTDWKAEAEKYKGIAQRLKTKVEKAKENKPEVKESKSQSRVEGLDRVDKLFLRSEKITTQDEIELVEGLMKETGKSVEQIIDSRYFQSELKSLREEKATKDATPSGSKRSGNSSKSEIDFWIEKGELPKDFDLAQKVVEAKRNKAKSMQKTFTDTPIV